MNTILTISFYCLWVWFGISLFCLVGIILASFILKDLTLKKEEDLWLSFFLILFTGPVGLILVLDFLFENYKPKTRKKLYEKLSKLACKGRLR